jgi:hypothetical protein
VSSGVSVLVGLLYIAVMGRKMPQIIAGLLAVTLGLWGLSVWWYSVEELLRGMLPLLLILFGVAALMSGVSRPQAAQKERSDQELMDQLQDNDDQPAARP